MYSTYDDWFWGGDLSSCAGFEVLVKRNSDSKKMCQEFEEYLKKRTKLEAEYSKSLQGLAKCLKPREETGVLEKSLNKFRCETEVLALRHNEAAAFFQQQTERLKRFREEQTGFRKSLEEQLDKSQNFKLSQLSKTIQLEKNYVRKFVDRDTAIHTFKEASMQVLPPKEIEKIRNKVAKAEEEAEKADSAYKSAVKVLEGCTLSWEKDMASTCQTVQDLDEKRLTFLRQELWVVLNMNSALALDTDNSSEAVRNILETCDVAADIRSFIQAAHTGNVHPAPFVFKHYTKIVALTANLVPGSDVYSSVEDAENSGNLSTPGALRLGFAPNKILKKKGVF